MHAHIYTFVRMYMNISVFTNILYHLNTYIYMHAIYIYIHVYICTYVYEYIHISPTTFAPVYHSRRRSDSKHLDLQIGQFSCSTLLSDGDSRVLPWKPVSNIGESRENLSECYRDQLLGSRNLEVVIILCPRSSARGWVQATLHHTYTYIHIYIHVYVCTIDIDMYQMRIDMHIWMTSLSYMNEWMSKGTWMSHGTYKWVKRAIHDMYQISNQNWYAHLNESWNLSISQKSHLWHVTLNFNDNTNTLASERVLVAAI